MARQSTSLFNQFRRFRKSASNAKGRKRVKSRRVPVKNFTCPLFADVHYLAQSATTNAMRPALARAKALLRRKHRRRRQLAAVKNCAGCGGTCDDCQCGIDYDNPASLLEDIAFLYERGLLQ
jgi:hypothetical protein